jgi:hypothetical protein
MIPLTIHILVLNDEKTIHDTLQSIQPLDAKIIIGDIGCTDQSLEICKKFSNIKIKAVPWHEDYSEARNFLVENDANEWQMYLNSGETLTGNEVVLDNLNGSNKKFYIIKDELITKETRLWRKKSCHFVNPVYENLQPDKESKLINVFVNGIETNYETSILLKWKSKSPKISKVDYYLACHYLINKNYSNFFKYADYYLFKEIEMSLSVIMTRYYCALTHLHINGNTHECLKNLVFCISEKPLMAEFWCATGDTFYKVGMVEKAAELYRNAIELGKHRLTNDFYPIELPKYNSYPKKMIELCDTLYNSIKK